MASNHEEKITIMQNIATEQQKTNLLNQVTVLQAEDLKRKKLPQLTHPSQLIRVITNDSGRTDHSSISLYWDIICDLSRRKKYRSQCGGIVCTYEELSKMYRASTDSIRRKLVRLEKLGLISRGFVNGNPAYPNLVNQLIIYVWKYTPYFINKSGIVSPLVQGGDDA